MRQSQKVRARDGNPQQPPGSVVQASDRLPGSTGVDHNALCAFQKPFAGAGQHETGCSAYEQTDTQIGLKRGNSSAESRARQAQPPCGFGNASCTCHLEKLAQPVKARPVTHMSR